MKPIIILHNSITLDGSLTGFMPDMELHYKIAGGFTPDANLIGSETVKTGQEMFGEGIPPEEPGDFIVPQRDSKLPLWVIIDSGGKLMGMLHTCRRFEYCRDILILVSDSTPANYLIHLEERNYKFIKAGTDKVNLKKALAELYSRYGVNKVVTDTGQVLGNLLLNGGLVDEISLLIHPIIIGKKSYAIFGNVTSELKLSSFREERFENGCIWVTYKVG